MLEPQPGDRIYDPTAGTAGMLISSMAEIKRRGGDARTLGLYGQERIHITAAIARMNLVLHGVEDFEIVVGNTLSPASIHRPRPPADLRTWSSPIRRTRSRSGTARRGSTTPGAATSSGHRLGAAPTTPSSSTSSRASTQRTGRCAILFPHGVLFRNEEAEMRRKLIELDLLECVLGLGPNLFYNSPMEACVVVCRARKPSGREGKVLFIDAVHDVARGAGPERSSRPNISSAFSPPIRRLPMTSASPRSRRRRKFSQKDGNLSISRYVRPAAGTSHATREQG